MAKRQPRILLGLALTFYVASAGTARAAATMRHLRQLSVRCQSLLCDLLSALQVLS